MSPDGEAGTESVLHLYFYLTHSMLLRHSGIVSTRVNLENVLLNEKKPDTERVQHYITYGLYIKSKPQKERIGWWLPGDGLEKRNICYMVNLLVMQKENILNI